MESVHEQVRMKIPAEAVELYTRYIHGEVSRRDFLRGVKRFAIAGLSAEALVQALMPNYALGQQVRKDDERIKASYETIPSPGSRFAKTTSESRRATRPYPRPMEMATSAATSSGHSARTPVPKHRPSCLPFSWYTRIAG